VPIALNNRISIHDTNQVRREKIVEERDGLNMGNIRVLLTLFFQNRSCLVPGHPALRVTDVVEGSDIPGSSRLRAARPM